MICVYKGVPRQREEKEVELSNTVEETVCRVGDRRQTYVRVLFGIKREVSTPHQIGMASHSCYSVYLYSYSNLRWSMI